MVTAPVVVGSPYQATTTTGPSSASSCSNQRIAVSTSLLGATCAKLFLLILMGIYHSSSDVKGLLLFTICTYPYAYMQSSAPANCTSRV